MSVDAELAAAERAFRESSSAEARLGWVRALRRAGRDDDAASLLCGGLDDAEVRREAARLPVWDCSRPGRFIDVRPLRRRPRVRWTLPLERPGAACAPLFASPFGVVTHAPGGGFEVIDADRGVVRHRVELDEMVLPRPLTLIARGRLVVVARGTLLGYDLVSGERTFALSLGAEDVCFTGEALVVATSGGELLALDPEAPDGTPIWARPLPESAALARRAMHGADRLLVVEMGGGGDELIVLDARTGAERWRVEGYLGYLDREGLVHTDIVVPGPDNALDRPRDVLIARDRDARERWRVMGAVAGIVSPAWVLMLVVDPDLGGVLAPGVHALGRVLGDRGHAFGPDELGPSHSIAARDGIYDWSVDAIAARGIDGTPWWRLSYEAIGTRSRLPKRPTTVRGRSMRLRAFPRVVALAAHDRRIYFIDDEDHLVCLEEDPA